MPIEINGQTVSDVVVNGQPVDEVTANGQTVFSGAIPDSGVSRWTFDDQNTSNDTAIDIWGDNDGAIMGVTTSVSGHDDGEAYEFDGEDDYVIVPDDSTLNPGTGDFSWSVWIHPYSWATSDTGNTLFAKGSTGSNDILVYNWAGQFRVHGAIYNETDEQLSGGGLPSTNTWTHIVVVRDGDWVGLYYDGTEVDSITGASGANIDNEADYTIGAREEGTEIFFDGRIDDHRWYDKALSSTEVSNLYSSGSID